MTTPNPTTRQPHNWQRWILATLITAIATGAFRLSFATQISLVTKITQIPTDIAWIYPIVVDLFIITAILTAAWVPNPSKWLKAYPWAAMTLFSAISITGNALDVITAPQTPTTTLTAAIYTVPPIALLIATHLAIITIIRRTPTHTPTTNTPQRSRKPVSVPSAAAERSIVRSESGVPAPDLAQLVALYQEHGSYGKVAELVGVSKSYVHKHVSQYLEEAAA